jgi:hypothetical protein
MSDFKWGDDVIRAGERYKFIDVDPTNEKYVVIVKDDKSDPISVMASHVTPAPKLKTAEEILVEEWTRAIGGPPIESGNALMAFRNALARLRNNEASDLKVTP